MIPRGLRRGPSWCMLTPHCRRYNVSFLWMLRRICIEVIIQSRVEETTTWI
jgi:hypothetical protein